MNQTPLTLADIARELASVNGCDIATAERFLREFFASISSALASRHKASVKGFGTFTVAVGPDGDPSVAFAPDADLAEGVNAPFALFDPIELAEGVTAEMLDEAKIDDFVPAPKPQKPEKLEEEAPQPEPEPEPVVEPEPEPEPMVEPEPEPEPEPAPQPVPEPAPEMEVEEVGCDAEESAGSGALRTLLWAVTAFVVGCFVGYFSYNVINSGVETNISANATESSPTEPAEDQTDEKLALDSHAKADSIANPAADMQTPESQPVKEPTGVVTDTVTSRRFLTTMSRHYYGAMEFWVYIYEENRSQLGHPDYIGPNTAVVIPPASKYGIDANDPESLRKARAKAIDIYKQFN